MKKHRYADRMYLDRKAIRDMRRFSDAEIRSLVDKAKALLEKCKRNLAQAAKENPKLFKAIKILSDVQAVINGVAIGGSASILMLKKSNQKLKDLSEFLGAIGFGPVKIMVMGVIGLITSIINWMIVNSASKEAESEASVDAEGFGRQAGR